MAVLHVYAVVDADLPLPDRTGVAGAELSMVRSGPVAAVVSPIDPDPEPTEDDAVAHWDVLTALVSGGPVLPMRFGTVAPDEDAVRAEVLDPAAEELRGALRAQDGVVEVRVTVRFDGPAALRAVLPGAHAGPGAGAEVSDRIAFGRQVAEDLTEATTNWADELLAPAAERAEAVIGLESPAPSEVRRALLVRRDRLRRVDGAVRELPAGAAPVPYAVEYVGPLPPVDFPAASDGGSRWGW